jgi:hypothetical protein
VEQLFLFGMVGGGVQLGQLGHQWPIVPAPGYYDGKIGGKIGWGNRSTRRKTCPSAALSTANPTCCPDANPGRRDGKPATNRLNYGTALHNLGSSELYPLPAFDIRVVKTSDSTKIVLSSMFVS